MNHLAREALLRAHENKHKQLYGTMHSATEEADCALGILHLTMHTNRNEAIDCPFSKNALVRQCRYYEKYEIEDRIHIILMYNDNLNLTFKEIAEANYKL